MIGDTPFVHVLAFVFVLINVSKIFMYNSYGTLLIVIHSSCCTLLRLQFF